jgi:hypothetical protein
VCATYLEMAQHHARTGQQDDHEHCGARTQHRAGCEQRLELHEDVAAVVVLVAQLEDAVGGWTKKVG